MTFDATPPVPSYCCFFSAWCSQAHSPALLLVTTKALWLHLPNADSEILPGTCFRPYILARSIQSQGGVCKNDDALNNGQFTVDFDGSEVAEALQLRVVQSATACTGDHVSAQLEGRLTAINTKLVEGFAQLDRRIKLDFERVFTPVVEAMVEVHEMRQSDFPLKWAGSLPLPVVRRLYRAWKSDGDEAVNLILTTELADDETPYLVSECRSVRRWLSLLAVAEALAHRQGNIPVGSY